MLTFLLSLACFSSTAEKEPVGPTRSDLPNVIVVTLDTTRADAMSAYGGPEGITPVFDQWASKGLFFEWAFSHSPTTLSAHSSLFTGLDPHGHAVPRNGFALGDAFETLAERLHSHGYDTLGVVGASVLNAEMGIQQGFRLFDDETPLDMGRRYEDRADSVTRRAIKLLEQREKDRPVFLWVHYYDAHSPYNAPRDFQERYVDPGYRIQSSQEASFDRLADRLRAGQMPKEDLDHLIGLYHAEVAWTDSQMGRLFSILESEKLLENSLVAITADHGEAFNEGRSHPLGHGHDIEQWATHIPLAIAGQGPYAPPTARIPQSVKLSDVAPTLLSLAKLPHSLGQGQDLSPIGRGEKLESTPIFMEASKPKMGEINSRWNNIGKEQGVVSGSRIFVHNPRMRPSDRLYDLKTIGVPIQDEEAQAYFKSLIDAWNDRAPPFRQEAFTEEIHEALKALGYLE